MKKSTSAVAHDLYMILNTDILYKKEHVYHEGHNLQTREEVDSQPGVHVHHDLFKGIV